MYDILVYILQDLMVDPCNAQVGVTLTKVTLF